MTDHEHLERLQALACVQTADLNSVFLILGQLTELLRKHHPELPDVTDQFLKLRKLQLQQQLEQMETQNPSLAARLQQLIDESATHFPFGYD